MKKTILSMLLAVVMVGSVISCNPQKGGNKPQISPKEEFLKEAKNGLNEYIKDNTYNPNAFKMSESKVVYLTDSACVIKFRFLAENQFGGHINGKAQWIWFNFDGNTYRSWQDNTDEDLYEFGDRWIDEQQLNPAMANLKFRMIEEDSIARKMMVKRNTLDFNNDFAELYCIVMEKGEKVTNKSYNKHHKD